MRRLLAAALLCVTGCASSFVELPFGDDSAIAVRAAFDTPGRATVEISFPERLALSSTPCSMVEHARDFVAESVEYDGERPDGAQWWYLRSFASPGYGAPHQGVRMITYVTAGADGKPKHSRYSIRLTAVGQDSSGGTHVMQAVADFPTTGAPQVQELCWRELTRQEVESGGVVLPEDCDCPWKARN